MQALSQDEQSARALGLSLLRAHPWPFRSATDGGAEFLTSNARLVKVAQHPDLVGSRVRAANGLRSPREEHPWPYELER